MIKINYLVQTSKTIITIRKCCLICEHINLIRPTCKKSGEDVSHECTLCDKFQLAKYLKEEKL